MEMSDHETYCGSRTERCDRCPDWVQLREWDSHQSRYHSNVQRRFRERSVIAQTETIIEYNNAGDFLMFWIQLHSVGQKI